MFGLPGCGKSTFLAKTAKYYQRLGVRVFVLGDYPVDGCYLIDFTDIGVYDMSNSVLLIDEISLYADNRDFKKFSQNLKKFFILHRHYNMDIVWFTQQYDGVDRKIRELTSQLYYVRRGRMGFYIATMVNKVMYVPSRRDLKENPSAEPRRAEVKVSIVKLATSFLERGYWKSLKLCYGKRYYKHFDSYTCPELPFKDFQLYQKSETK